MSAVAATGVGPVTPRSGATVMVVRDGNAGLEVLLLRRSDRASFVPGAHVFPGGAVDPHDHDDAYRRLTDTAVDLVNPDDPDDLAHRVAAIRECLEEAGLLLARHRDGAPLAADHPLVRSVSTLRHDVEHGRVALATVLADHDLMLPVADVHPVARWITPAESPIRFDTRFYIAAEPLGQSAVADDREVGDARWWQPHVALTAWQAGEIQLIEPTFESLCMLRGHDTADDALAALADRPIAGNGP